MQGMPSNDCWLWPGGKNAYGYGTIATGGRGGGESLVHLVAYRLTYGEIPDGLHVDHTCHGADLECPGGKTCPHRRCLNPAHLEAVTQAENNRRMQARKLKCPEGHPLEGENLYVAPATGHRECRTCRRRNMRNHYARNIGTRDARNAKRRAAYAAKVAAR